LVWEQVGWSERADWLCGLIMVEGMMRLILVWRAGMTCWNGLIGIEWMIGVIFG